MKIIAKREVILAPLQAVIGVVERRQTMPILANVLLAAKSGQLSVTATDLEVELVASTQVDVQRSGEITVPGRKCSISAGARELDHPHARGERRWCAREGAASRCPPAQMSFQRS
jgi:hypothetical protein